MAFWGLVGLGALSAIAIRRLTYTNSDSIMKDVSLDGKVAIVTGANTGIGLETTYWLAKAGAHVILACRSKEKAEEAIKQIRARSSKELKLSFLPLDLADFQSIQLFTQAFLKLKLPLHILILNAGLAGAGRHPTKEGLELTFGSNHFGHFVLTYLLLDVLRETSKTASRPSRIVVVASESHRQTYKPKLQLDELWVNSEKLQKTFFMELYGQSKLANVLFVKELHKRYGKELDAFSLHPGSLISTDIGRGSIFTVVGLKLISIWTKNVNQGSATTLYCATDEKLSGKGGGYYNGCKLAKESASAKDEQQAKLLWDQSEEYLNKFAKKYESKSNL